MTKVISTSVLLLAALLSTSAQSTCPNIVTRGAWLARTPDLPLPLLTQRPAPFLIVHPTGTAPCSTPNVCSSLIRDIQTFHMEANLWPDISYHFLIGEDNRIYAGRGWARQGENVGDFSNQAINVGYIGRFNNARPTESAAALLNNLIDCGISQGTLAQNVTVIAQCQVAPIVGCSQTTIFDWVSENPRFISDPIAVSV